MSYCKNIFLPNIAFMGEVLSTAPLALGKCEALGDDVAVDEMFSQFDELLKTLLITPTPPPPTIFFIIFVRITK